MYVSMSMLQNAHKENLKIRETEEKILRARAAKEKADREKRERLNRKKQLIDMSKGTRLIVATMCMTVCMLQAGRHRNRHKHRQTDTHI